MSIASARTLTLTATIALTATITLLLSSAASAQRVSELRDAQRSVFRAFPDADRYRTIPRDIGDRARREIEKRLPFKVHFDALGRHRIYVALCGMRPIGLLYSRTETSRWGLSEIAWSLTLDLRIDKFRFQRCRHESVRAVERSGLKHLLTGRAASGLASLLDKKGALIPTPVVPRGGEVLATTVVRSGIMALVVADVVWRDEIDKLADLQMAIDAFPTGKSFRRFVHRVAAPKASGPGPSPRPLGESTPPGAGGTKAAPWVVPELETVRAVRVRNRGGGLLGTAVQTDVRQGSSDLRLRWRIGPKGRVLEVCPVASWPSTAMRVECRKLMDGPGLGSARKSSPMYGFVTALKSILDGFGSRVR